MAVYFADTEITGIKDLFPLSSKDITGLYFADTELFTIWGEYDGALPATYSANGSTLVGYRIYGAAGGVGIQTESGEPTGYKLPMSVSDGTTSTTTPIYVGDEPLGEDEYVDYVEGKVYRRTENLWNFDESAQGDGYVANQLLISTGIVSSNEFFISEYIPVVAGQTYTYFTDLFRASRGVIKYYSFDGGSATYVNYTQQKPILNRESYSSSKCASFTVPTGTAKTITHIRISVDKEATMFFIVEGSTAPSTYIPYLQPTDPPVPLPALPTVDGTNIVDYAGQSAAVPRRFVAKYRKEGFK